METIITIITWVIVAVLIASAFIPLMEDE